MHRAWERRRGQRTRPARVPPDWARRLAGRLGRRRMVGVTGSCSAQTGTCTAGAGAAGESWWGRHARYARGVQLGRRVLNPVALLGRVGPGVGWGWERVEGGFPRDAAAALRARGPRKVALRAPAVRARRSPSHLLCRKSLWHRGIENLFRRRRIHAGGRVRLIRQERDKDRRTGRRRAFPPTRPWPHHERHTPRSRRRDALSPSCRPRRPRA